MTALPWRGAFPPCRGCGGTHLPELFEGRCADCFQGMFGPLGLADVPAEETTMAMTNEDLPRIFQDAPRLCSGCKETKPEDDYAPVEWVKARWRLCLACQADEAPDPPQLAVVPAAAETRRCARCKADKPTQAFTPAMWAMNPGSRWCKACLNAYKRERDAAKRQIAAGPALAVVPAAKEEEPIIIEMGWELDAPAPLAPTPAPPAHSRAVVDELRALLDALARERAALEEERVRLATRLEELTRQVGAMETTIALLTTKESHS